MVFHFQSAAGGQDNMAANMAKMEETEESFEATSRQKSGLRCRGVFLLKYVYAKCVHF